jgi:HlyD family secretion protein
MLLTGQRWAIPQGVPPLYRLTGPLLLSGLLITAAGCNSLPGRNAESAAEAAEASEAIAVEATTAGTGSVEDALEYTGTTRPNQQVSLRAQVEGQVVSLTVDAGDAVTRGAALGQLNSRLLAVDVSEAEAELDARRSEVAQAQAAVGNARTDVERAKVALRQAQADRDRLQRLADAGAISDQEAEQAQLTLETAQQAVLAAEEQLRSQQQTVNSNQGRVQSQQAVVAQTQERLSYATLNSPLTGKVLNRLVEPGDFVQSGQAVLELGDLSAIKVTVQLSELDLGQIRLGQPVQVRLDAFPDETISGQVTRIAPAADATSRLIPIEVTIPNPDSRIGSGLLARVRFEDATTTRVVVPESALQLAEDPSEPTLFIIQQPDTEPTVLARTVQVGTTANGQVEILSGLNPGEVFVLSSADPLEDGQAVRLSILSDVEG